MNTPLKILVIEDNPSDFRLLEKHLKHQGLAAQCHCVASQAALSAALAAGGWDLVLSDYHVPGLAFQHVLTQVHQHNPDLPVILISGSMGEDNAVELLKQGVWDFVLKDRPQRLASVIERNLRDAVARRAQREAEADLQNSRRAALNMMEDAVEARKRTEQINAALRESEEQFRAMFEMASIGMAQADPHTGRFLRVNQKMCAITGYSVDELLALRVRDVTHPDDRAADGKLFQRVIRGAQPDYQIEKRYLRKDGTVIWVSINMTVIRGTQGRPLRTMATIEDITARKQAAETLRQSEERYRRLVDNASDAIYVAQDGIIRFANRACAQLTGYGEAELIGKRSAAFAVPAEQARVAERQRRLAHGETLPGREEFRVHFRDSVERWISLGSVQILWKDQPATLNFATDITARKQAEQALLLQSAALAAAANAIVITDANGNIEWANPAFTTITGYTLDEARGKNPRDLLRSGQHNPAFYRVMWGIILAGDVWHGEVVNHRKDGKLYTEEMTITPLRDAAGGITHFIAIKQDITERKNLEAHLLRTQRLESVGRLASGIAHDLNNILAPVLLAPPLLREAIRDPVARSLVDTIESSAQRGAEVIKQLLTFGRGLKGERIPLQLRTLVSEMLKLIAETFPKNITARAQLPAELPLVIGDATQLHQILMNLSVNARDAMPAGGTLTFNLDPVTLDAAAAAALPDAKTGSYVVLGVSDTGTGITPENMEKIFDPFFTTKAIGEGTGLGLSTVLGIVRSHGGCIQVQSTLGQGTRFNIYLPTTEKSAAAAAETAGPPPKGRGELVLVVDDEENVRRMTRRILESNGYRIVEAQDGAEALVMLENLRQPVQAVLTDLLMPRMDGLALIRAVRRKNPRLPILAAGGLPPPPETLRELGLTTQAFLAKPFFSADLLKALRHVLA